MAPKTKADAKPKGDKAAKKPAPKKVDASKKEAKGDNAPVKAVQKALKVSGVLSAHLRCVDYNNFNLRSRRRW